MTRFKEILPKVLPTGAALLLFFIVSALYFAPQSVSYTHLTLPTT